MSNFTFEKTAIDGLTLIHTKTFNDSRGYFMESYKQSDWDEAGLPCRFVQCNQAGSTRGVLRGLHFQKKHPQAKLVRILHGEVFDVAVDLRKGSRTYGKWGGAVLSEANRQQLFIPRGFAHGYAVLSDTAEMLYMCDDVYHPEDEGGILWSDPGVGIDWPRLEPLILNERDKAFPTLAESGIEFEL